MKRVIILATLPTGASPDNGEIKEAKKSQKKTDRNLFTLKGNFAFDYDLSDHRFVKRCEVVIKKQNDAFLEDEAPESYIKNKYLVYAEDEEKGLVFIDLGRIPNDDYNIKKAIWIKKYASEIEYTLTGQFTEKAHKISNPEEIKAIYPKPLPPTMPPGPKPTTLTYKEIAIGDLVNTINKRIQELNPAHPNPSYNYYKNDLYNYYLEFYLNNNGDLDVYPVKEFTNTRLLFSIPMLESIIKAHNLTNLHKLGIGTVAFGSIFPFVYVYITDNEKHYYDYSNEPR